MKVNAHNFNVKLATLIGLNEAIILQHFWYWHENNSGKAERLKGEHPFPWSHNTIESIEKIFPYLKGGAIRGAIDRLVKGGWIVTGNFNKLSFDKTKWYSITEKTHRLFECSFEVESSDCSIDKSGCSNDKSDCSIDNSSCSNENTIPYSNPDSNQLYDNKQNNNSLEDSLDSLDAYAEEEEQKFISLFEKVEEACLGHGLKIGNRESALNSFHKIGDKVAEGFMHRLKNDHTFKPTSLEDFLYDEEIDRMGLATL